MCRKVGTGQYIIFINVGDMFGLRAFQLFHHESTSRTVQMTFASGNSSQSSGVKRAVGVSVTPTYPVNIDLSDAMTNSGPAFLRSIALNVRIVSSLL